MWFWRQSPLNGAARQREIARLEGKRDYLLENAGRSVAFRRIFIPMAFAVFAVVWGIGIVTHPAAHQAMSLLVYAAVLFVVGRFLVRYWFRPPPKGDLWADSDTIAYDGDSPRDVQKKIDTLRAQDET
jgi:hypothetical protein